ILVDGLEKDQEYIKNLSPDRLKKIEIIRDPGGRYALEGYSAVINIILKKDYQGTELFISDRPILDPDAVKRNYIPVQNNSSATFNYTYNKINAYAKYSGNYNNFNLPSIDTKDYNNGLTISKTPPASDEMNTHVKQLFNNYTLGADFSINPKHTVSFESNLANQPSSINQVKELNDITFIQNGNTLSKYSGSTNSVTENLNMYHSLFYVGKLNENNTLNSNFTYSNYNNTYSNLITENTIYQRQENGTDKKDNTKFYFEYTHSFNAKSNLQAGYGNTWEQRNNIFTASDVSSIFKYSDTRHKLYSYYSWQPNKKFGIKVGGAGETSSPEANGIKNNYIIGQPYADIRYKPSQLFDFKLKYRAGSTYPNISQTNPFTYVIDQQSIRTGNPYLHPEVTHKISLQAVFAEVITLEPYYHFSNNYITETGMLKNDSLFVYSYNNMGKYKNYGVQSHFTIPFSKSIFLKTDMDFFKGSITYADQINNVHDWTMTGQLIYARQKSGTVAVLEYQRNLSKDITAQGYNMEGNDFWIFLVKQPFLKQKLEVMLLYFTPITLGVDFKQGNYIQTANYSEYKYGDISFLKNMFLIEISYRFNKGKSVNKTEKNIEENKEKNAKSLF
ncbi:MAG TPA: outer membrane beta-barrel protein, partial [Bacteroidia bacterium]